MDFRPGASARRRTAATKLTTFISSHCSHSPLHGCRYLGGERNSCCKLATFMAAKGVAATLKGVHKRGELDHLRVCILGQELPNARREPLASDALLAYVPNVSGSYGT